MKIGRVVGTVVATRKEDRIAGFKLQVVEAVGLDLQPTGAFTVAVDETFATLSAMEISTANAAASPT